MAIDFSTNILALNSLQINTQSFPCVFHLWRRETQSILIPKSNGLSSFSLLQWPFMGLPHFQTQ